MSNFQIFKFNGGNLKPAPPKTTIKIRGKPSQIFDNKQHVLELKCNATFSNYFLVCSRCNLQLLISRREIPFLEVL